MEIWVVIPLYSRTGRRIILGKDLVIVVEGARKDIKGPVEKIEGDNVHTRPTDGGYAKAFGVRDKEVCKCFNHGKHLKLVSGATESSECGNSLASTSTQLRIPRRVSISPRAFSRGGPPSGRHR
ncbi:putative transcription elongation factor SPT5 homolog 1 [Cornus florida]|uniref:putative transcription elongation factor SPT5 homolog 1 n=1 Tax=Cornus florida TaxID=4283 RepID=UPI0028A18AA9|nr:putative transcription elongation factor SPT5 homolog 1 [Cornus florida]